MSWGYGHANCDGNGYSDPDGRASSRAHVDAAAVIDDACDVISHIGPFF